jgi:predicted DNA-binding protein YlxM (UPF0122 family)
MLFDFYGDLLTDKQREYYDLHYNGDLSLGEIAEQFGVSRQAVWDIIRRAENILTETEEKTGLVARFQRLRGQVAEIEALVHRSRENPELLDQVLERLNALKD